MDNEVSPMRMKPSLYFSNEDFPIAEELKSVGDSVHLEIDAIIKSVSINENDKGKKTQSVTLEIQDIYTEEDEYSKESNADKRHAENMIGDFKSMMNGKEG